MLVGGVIPEKLHHEGHEGHEGLRRIDTLARSKKRTKAITSFQEKLRVINNRVLWFFVSFVPSW
jgi:hypothetical protein